MNHDMIYSAAVFSRDTTRWHTGPFFLATGRAINHLAKLNLASVVEYMAFGSLSYLLSKRIIQAARLKLDIFNFFYSTYEKMTKKYPSLQYE